MAGRLTSGIGKAAVFTTTAVAGIEAAQKVWEVANKDGQLTSAAARVRDGAATRLAARSPLAQLERALDAADAALADLSPADDAATDNDAATDTTGAQAHARWAREAATLRAKLVPLTGLPAAKQRRVAGDLRQRANALLDEIVHHDLEPTGRRRRGRRAQG